MRDFLRLTKIIGMIAGIFVLHITVSYLTPFPFNHLNIILIFLVWAILRRDFYRTIWLTIALGFLSELFAANSFGFNLIALIACICFLNWILRNIFTSHAWYLVLVAGFVAVISYRFILLLEMLVNRLFTRAPLYLTTEYFQMISLEIVLNTIGLTILYALGIFFGKKRFNPRYI